MQKSRLIGTTLALGLAVTALAGCGSDSNDEGGAASTAGPSATSESSSSPSATSSEAPAEDSGQTVQVTVKGDSISPSNERIAVDLKKGLTVEITSDRAGEVHVHSSPEQYVEFKAGTTTKKLTFSVPGVVEMEEHESGDLIAQLEVR